MNFNAHLKLNYDILSNLSISAFGAYSYTSNENNQFCEDEVTIRAQKDNSLIIDGLAYLEDVEEELEVDFGDVEFETLNGYLTNILGHIPTAKDVDTVITAVGYCFTILSIGNKTIGKVKVEKDRKDPASENTQVHNDCRCSVR